MPSRSVSASSVSRQAQPARAPKSCKHQIDVAVEAIRRPQKVNLILAVKLDAYKSRPLLVK
ncbi:hypothetical protein ABIA85_009189 [Bradyrhizobium sp. LA6.10]